MILISACNPPTKEIVGTWKFVKATENSIEVQIYNLDVIGSRSIKFMTNGELKHYNGDSRVGIGTTEYKVTTDSLYFTNWSIEPEGKRSRSWTSYYSIKADTLIIQDESRTMFYERIE